MEIHRTGCTPEMLRSHYMANAEILRERISKEGCPVERGVLLQRRERILAMAEAARKDAVRLKSESQPGSPDRR